MSLFIVPTDRLAGHIRCKAPYALCRSLSQGDHVVVVASGSLKDCEKAQARLGEPKKPSRVVVVSGGISEAFDAEVHQAIEERRQLAAGQKYWRRGEWFTYDRDGQAVSFDDPSWNRDEWNAFRSGGGLLERAA